MEFLNLRHKLSHVAIFELVILLISGAGRALFFIVFITLIL